MLACPPPLVLTRSTFCGEAYAADTCRREAGEARDRQGSCVIAFTLLSPRSINTHTHTHTHTHTQSIEVWLFYPRAGVTHSTRRVQLSGD